MSEADDRELVPLMNTTDGTLLTVIRSLLESAEIPHVIQGEAGVSLFPLGPFGSEVTRRITGTIVLVPQDRLEEARALLEADPELPEEPGNQS